MKQRCLNPRAPKYPRYGGAGVTICPEWIDSFDRFLTDLGERPANTTLDRIDGSLGYTKDNCRWSTVAEQQRNLKSNVRIEYAGEVWVLADLAKAIGINKSTLAYRVKTGWPVERWADRISRKSRAPIQPRVG